MSRSKYFILDDLSSEIKKSCDLFEIKIFQENRFAKWSVANLSTSAKKKVIVIFRCRRLEIAFSEPTENVRGFTLAADFQILTDNNIKKKSLELIRAQRNLVASHGRTEEIPFFVRQGIKDETYFVTTEVSMDDHYNLYRIKSGKIEEVARAWIPPCGS